MKILNLLRLSSDDFKESNKIVFCDGYKYQLRKPALFKTPIIIEKDIVTELVVLRRDGWLIIDKYFAWDGCSGPTWDDKTNMRACLAHDALYYLMRTGLLDISYRDVVDQYLHDLMNKDGAIHLRSDYYQWAVQTFAKNCAKPGNGRREKTAP